MPPLHAAYVVEDYPAFLVAEIRALQALGTEVTVVSAFRPEPQADPAKDALRRDALYFPVGYRGVFAANVRTCLRFPGRYAAAVRLVLRHGESMRFVILAGYLVSALRRRGVTHIHGTFGTRTTTLAAVLSALSGITFSFTTHAYDVFNDNRSLVWKTERAVFHRTISRFNAAYLGATYPGLDTGKIAVVHLGVDTREFAAVIPPAEPPIRLLVISDLIEQKGHRILLEACARLRDRGVAFTVLVIGDGPERRRLQELATERSLGDSVTFEPPCAHASVPGRHAEAHVFVLPCIDQRGRGAHVDGIPVVLMEAMASGLAVVSTRLSGIPELIEHDVSGLLVPERDPDALADALERLAHESATRARLGAAARARVVERFDLARNTAALAELMTRHHPSIPA